MMVASHSTEAFYSRVLFDRILQAPSPTRLCKLCTLATHSLHSLFFLFITIIIIIKYIFIITIIIVVEEEVVIINYYYYYYVPKSVQRVVQHLRAVRVGQHLSWKITEGYHFTRELRRKRDRALSYILAATKDFGGRS